MRCSEAKRRLSQRPLDRAKQVDDLKLREHLQECSGCSRHAAALEALNRDLAMASVHDTDGGLPLSFIKSRVEARASITSSGKIKENPLMAAFTKSFRKRPRVSVSIVTAVVVLAFLTLIPFKLDRTVGYEVAVAGVDKALALDGDRVTALLNQLGLEGAAVDVTDCAATCNVIIRELKSQKDADLVAAAFKSGGGTNVNLEIICDIRKIIGEESGSLLNHANNMVFFSIGDEDVGDAQAILVERLGEKCDGNAFIWMQYLDDSTVEGNVQVKTIELVGDEYAFVAADGSLQIGKANQLAGGANLFVKQFADGDSANLKCIIIGGDGNGLPELCGNLNLADGDLDEEMIKKLEAMGCEVTIEKSEDGTTKRVTINCSGAKGSLFGDEETDDAAARESGAGLPEGFELAQNYPNPFNPSTTIDFSLPQTGHVTLEVINVMGQKVRTLIDDVRSSGSHSVVWNGDDDAGSPVATGMYFYRLTAGENISTKKMSLVK